MRCNPAMLTCLAASLLFSVPAFARDLTMVSFGGSLQDATREAWVDPFSKETKTPVKMDTYNGSLSLIRAQVDAGTVNWDVADIESNDVLQGCQEGYLEPLDWSRLKVAKTDLLAPSASLTPCGVGMFTGALVLAYDGDKIKDGPKTWADFWDVKKYPGKRGLGADPKRSMEIAMMADGVPPDQVYAELRKPGGIDRAFKKLDELKPYITWYKLGAEAIQLLSSGEVSMVPAFSGRVIAANRSEKRNFKMSWDAGGIYFVEYAAIVKGTPNLDKAYDLLNYIIAPKNQARFPQYIGYGPTNLKAYSSIDPKYAADLMTPEMVKHTLQRDDTFWNDHNDELTQRFNVWLAK